MSTALNTSFLALLTIVTVWMIVFGASGYFYSRALGVSPAFGIAVSVVFGPLGWLAITLAGKRTAMQSGGNAQATAHTTSGGNATATSSDGDDGWVL